MNARLALAVCAVLAAGLAAPANGESTGPQTWLPDNPYMSTSGAATMHSDSYASDTHPFPGPVGHGTTVRFSPKGPCAGMAVTKEKLLLLQCGGVSNFTLRLVDPATLSDLATYNLPPRPSTTQAVVDANIDRIYSDSSGAYFYLDDQDRVVVADAAQHIQRVAHVLGANGTWTFVRTDDWDLTPYLPHDCASWTNPKPSGSCDPVTGVLPDWNGLLWWVSRYGRVGTIDPATGAVHVTGLPGEEIENSHAVSEDGVSIVSDHALYQFDALSDGTPHIQWREEYDRGTTRKSGQINQGSGTTPTFLGHDYVAITDNADPMNVLVYRRAPDLTGSRLFCKVPVFAKGASATENSLVGWNGGLVVENNFGYHDPTSLLGGKTVVGGLTRVDVDTDGCHVAWSSTEHSPSVVPKLSRADGLVYVYTKNADPTGVDAWHLTGIDFGTGQTRFSVQTGVGPGFDNAWAPITLGSDGTAYISCFGGLIAARDAA